MLSVCLLASLCVVVSGNFNHPSTDPAGQQLLNYKRNASHPSCLTTHMGAPVSYDDAYYTLDRPTLIRNNHFIQSMAHFTREQIPDRVIHAKAAGAFGYFEVTQDISHLTKAKVFCGVGTRTKVVVRLSLSTPDAGGSDLVYDLRGFSTKFYTTEGNFDLLMINLPVFLTKDPVFFVSSVKSGKRNPVTNLPDSNSLWDFVTQRPESAFGTMTTFAATAVPRGYEHMEAFALHTFQLVNEQGDYSFVRFKWCPDAGVEAFPPEDVATVTANDPDYLTRRLYNQIEKGDFPSFTLMIQVRSHDEVKNAVDDPFDVNLMWPEDKYPFQPIGRMCLNRNPSNFFAEVTQAAFNPANLVPGVVGAPDKVFEGRMFAYLEAQVYRLGVNFPKIPVNCPLATIRHTINRNGRSPVLNNEGGAPDYIPNSFNGARPCGSNVQVVKAVTDYSFNNYEQASKYYQDLSKKDQKFLIENIADSVVLTYDFLQKRVVKLFTTIDKELGHRLACELNSTRTQEKIMQSYPYYD